MIQQRLSTLNGEVQSARQEIADERRERKEQVKTPNADLSDRIEAVESITHDVPPDGLRLEALGLFLVGVGTVVQSFA